ncbi:unnamed protein product [Rhizopus stolonifer]
MPPKRRGLLQRSAPKQFRCTGYGQCNMVFTRSEHLARHERKHTGEKPYKCVVENCGRMFSRFDNMMQHTQTHERKKFAALREEVEDQAKTKKARAVLTDDHVTDSPIQIQEEALPWFQQTEPYQVPPLEYTPMMYNRTLPPPHRRLSIPSNTSGFYRPYPYSTSPSPVKTHFCHSSNMHFSHPPPPPPIASDSYYRRSHYPPRNRSSWPIRSYDEFEPTRRSSTSTASTDSGHTSSPPSLTHDFAIKRRISIDALQTPIENLKTIQLDEKPVKKESVDITQDEYEALEAFSQFRSSSVMDSSSPVTSSPRDSPRLSSQVCAIRQSVPTSKLSFSRPVFHNYLG